MKIRVIHPVITETQKDETDKDYISFTRPDSELSFSFIERGPESIESQYEVAVASPDILIQIRRAEKEGMDAVIINCIADPGLDAAREMASIPVIGLGEASLYLASMLAHKFSVITILERDIPDLDRMFRKYSLLSKVASVRVINIPVLDLFGNDETVAKAATQASLLAVREDGAAAIAFGCSGLSGVIPKISENLSKEGLNIPVIDPVAAGIKLAESLVDMGLIFSKITYPDPPTKKIIFP